MNMAHCSQEVSLSIRRGPLSVLQLLTYFQVLGEDQAPQQGFKAIGLSAINPSAVISAGSQQSSSFERKIKVEPNGWGTVQSQRELAAAFSKSFNVANDCLPK